MDEQLLYRKIDVSKLKLEDIRSKIDELDRLIHIN